MPGHRPGRHRLTADERLFHAGNIPTRTADRTYAYPQHRYIPQCACGIHLSAYAMLTDAAMLRWLDGQSSTAKAPNENLAREFMELFALGHGNGYTEDDVRDGARALTGWVIGADGHTSMAPKRHDGTAKTLFGQTRDFDAAGFCDAVLAQPKSAEYVAGRLWRQLASDDPPSPRALEQAGLRLRPGPGPAGADPGDPHRRRIHRRPRHCRQHPGRMARRRAAGAAGAHRHRHPKGRRRDVARARAAAVLPAERRRLAAGPGMAVHRQRRKRDCGPPAGWRTPATCPASRAPPPLTGSMRSAI